MPGPNLTPEQIQQRENARNAEQVHRQEEYDGDKLGLVRAKQAYKDSGEAYTQANINALAARMRYENDPTANNKEAYRVAHEAAEKALAANDKAFRSEEIAQKRINWDKGWAGIDGFQLADVPSSQQLGNGHSTPAKGQAPATQTPPVTAAAKQSPHHPKQHAEGKPAAAQPHTSRHSKAKHGPYAKFDEKRGLGTLYFGNNQTEPNKQDKQIIDKLAAAWAKDKTQRIELTGFASGHDTLANKQLAGDRAVAIRDYLNKHYGIDTAKIVIQDSQTHATRSVAFKLAAAPALDAAPLAAAPTAPPAVAPLAPDTTPAAAAQPHKPSLLQRGLGDAVGAVKAPFEIAGGIASGVLGVFRGGPRDTFTLSPETKDSLRAYALAAKSQGDSSINLSLPENGNPKIRMAQERAITQELFKYGMDVSFEKTTISMVEQSNVVGTMPGVAGTFQSREEMKAASAKAAADAEQNRLAQRHEAAINKLVQDGILPSTAQSIVKDGNKPAAGTTAPKVGLGIKPPSPLPVV